MNKPRSFRDDIVGFRALAVMLVLLSHFRIPGFGFGFIGVDIFFVISGFLITRLLYSEYLTSATKNYTELSISLSNFYFRRIRRLLPAALVVILLVNVISLFLINSISRAELVLDSKWALLFLANAAFLRSESDYFQQNEEPSMLQHYWSLSVEEQFYFIWPLLFLLAANLQKLRFKKIFIRFNVRILVLIAAVSVSSFLFLQLGFKRAPTEAYFSIFTRAWELGVGSFFGILAYHKKKNSVYSNFEQYFPIILALLTCAIFIDSHNWARLIPIPVIATGIFLYLGQDKLTVNTHKNFRYRFLKRIVVYLGSISYSLYLIHWPVFIIASHLNLLDNFLNRILLFPVSIIFAHLLWKYIEVPFQKIPLPMNGMLNDKLFHFIKSRRIVIAGLTFLLVGSLYVVTYPNIYSQIFKPNLNLADDPKLKKFSDYEANILFSESNSPLEIVQNPAGSTPVDSQDLSTLTLQVINGLKEGLKKSSLSEEQIAKFSILQSDVSPFEASKCSLTDSEVPVNCSTGSNSPTAKKVILIGDSKMGFFAQPLIDYFSAKGWRVYPIPMSGCHMSDPDPAGLMANCKKRSLWALNHVSQVKYDLAISSEWPGYTLDKVYKKNYFQTIQNSVGKLIIFQSNLKTTSPTTCIGSNFTWNKSCEEISADGKLQLDAGLSSTRALRTSNTYIIESQNWICVGYLCPFTSNGNLVTRDGSHLTYSYVKALRPLINATLDSVPLS